MKARIDLIRVGKRVRRDMGNIEALAESISRHGLLHPVVVTNNLVLVAGLRRIKAAEHLGWNVIEATCIDVDDLLSAERDENEVRKNFTPTEAVAIGRLIEERERPKAQARKRAGVKSLEPSSQMTEGSRRGETLDHVAAAVGMGRNSYVRAKQVVEAAETDLANFGDLPARMDETGNISGTLGEVERRRNGKSSDKRRRVRHPIHNNVPHARAEKVIARLVDQLEGSRLAIHDLDVSGLDREQARAWARSLRASTRVINVLAREMTA